MGYIIGLIAVTLFFTALHYFTELKKRDKIAISLFLLVTIMLAISYNNYTSKEQERTLEVVRKFEQNKTVTCKGVDVNQSNFSLSVGTYTFIGKKNTPYYGQMVSASTCQ